MSAPIHAHTPRTAARLCPVCYEPVGIGFGRPRTYCSVDCRRQMERQRIELRELEEQTVEAREKAASWFWPRSALLAR